jgi:hypothetical protein
MLTYIHSVLVDQIVALSEKLGGPFPYEDCRHLLLQMHENSPGSSKRYEDLTSDLDGYLYLVESHSSGAEHLLGWPASELTISQTLLKNSFFQAHKRYREIEWMINEINTPRLSLMLAASNELRVMLQKLIFDLIEESQRANTARQEEFLFA